MKTRIVRRGPWARISPGTRLQGTYEIDSLIATGGMGEIYKGHSVTTGDAVAIKTIRPDLAENEAVLALFRKEAIALSKLMHEAIVHYHVFSDDPEIGCPYLVMEFVDGPSLGALLRKGPLPIEKIRVLISRLAPGLEEAHRHGIIHRDIAPDNIILPGGAVERAKIIDFGIARTPHRDEGTIIGTGFAGKQNYVSPEQLGLFGGQVGPRSDIYSLGLVLAEAATGRPFDMGGTQAEVLAKRKKLPDLSGVDRTLRPLVTRMLQPDPAQRPASMAEIAAWRPGAAIGGGRRRVGLAAAALAGLALLGGGAFVALPLLSEPEPSSLRERLSSFGALLPPSWRGTQATRPEAIEGIPPTPELLAANPRPNPVPEPAAPPEPPPPPPRSDPAPQAPAPAEPAPPVAAPPPMATPQQRIAQMSRFIRDFSSADCLYLIPWGIREKSVTVEGYGAEREPFIAFNEAFRRSFGFEPEIELRQILKPQCALIPFLRHPSLNEALSPQFDLAVPSLKSGQPLSATVSRFSGLNVQLLLLSDDGFVHNLDSLARRNGDQVSLNFRITGNGKKGFKPQVLIALASSKPFATLTLGFDRPVLAEELIPKLMEEAADGRSFGIAVRFFRLED